jgi:hypothetical protein
MISFKTREDYLPSSLMLISIVLLLGCLIYMIVVPAPTTAGDVISRNAKINTVTSDILYSRKRANEARAAVVPKLWTGSSNHVSAAVLALITANTSQNSLKLTAFRPQRTVDLDGVTELPYTVQLAGTFADIRDVMRSLDAGNSKVVLRSVQVNASEEVTNTVQATLVISAYIASSTDDSTTSTKGDVDAQT